MRQTGRKYLLKRFQIGDNRVGIFRTQIVGGHGWAGFVSARPFAGLQKFRKAVLTPTAPKHALGVMSGVVLRQPWTGTAAAKLS